MSKFDINKLNSWPNLRAYFSQLFGNGNAVNTKSDLFTYAMRMSSGETFAPSGYEIKYVHNDSFGNDYYQLVESSSTYNTIILRLEYPFTYYVSIALIDDVAHLQSGKLFVVTTDITGNEFVPKYVLDGSEVEELFTDGVYTPEECTEYLIFSYDEADHNIINGAIDSEDALAYKNKTDSTT